MALDAAAAQKAAAFVEIRDLLVAWPLAVQPNGPRRASHLERVVAHGFCQEFVIAADQGLQLALQMSNALHVLDIFNCTARLPMIAYRHACGLGHDIDAAVARQKRHQISSQATRCRRIMPSTRIPVLSKCLTRALAGLPPGCCEEAAYSAAPRQTTQWSVPCAAANHQARGGIRRCRCRESKYIFGSAFFLANEALL